MPNLFSPAIWEIIAAGKRLAAQGLVCAHAGNISRRLNAETVLITAAGIFKGALEEQDVLYIDYQGRLLDTAAGLQPSTETGLHLALYRGYSRIAAIVHAHPPHATALATAGRAPDWRMLEESGLFTGPAALLPRLSAGSQELAQAAAAAARGANALLLAGHGAVSWGESVEQALCRMEILEHTAQTMLLNGLFGRAAMGHV
jgi:L-fuculose-phosphate aldolase